MLYVVLLIVVALAVMAFFVLAWWGGVIILLLAAGFGLYLAAARRQDPSVGTVERGRRREPTGVPRSAGGDAETANQRVGQE